MGNNDHALIRAVLAGDKDAYGVLVARHGESMFRVAFRITENEHDAEEIVQETFLRGYRSLAEFDARADFRTWIYRIAVNCGLQVLSKRKSAAAVAIVEEFDEERPGVQLANGKAGPERLLLDREIEHRRQAAMDKMTPDERLAFVLRHLEGRSTEEIAAALDETNHHCVPFSRNRGGLAGAAAQGERCANQVRAGGSESGFNGGSHTPFERPAMARL